MPVTFAPSRHATEIDSVPFSDGLVWVNVTENVPEASELDCHVPFHVPVRAEAESPPDVGVEDTGAPVLSVLSPGVELEVVAESVELLLQPASRAPHRRSAPNIRRGAGRIT